MSDAPRLLKMARTKPIKGEVQELWLLDIYDRRYRVYVTLDKDNKVISCYLEDA